ncbi:PRTRC system protein E [Sphingobacterium sp.]|uniref:PRTRC system protein E n=1 Tax=Sphingobacterium sp. TaxID=341027 RepID=UPI00258E5E02|nr:PRTRC system protein E [Sphingobacterium sp.]WET69054.1 MAG: PRTRC system protein E [Sphingobacterium sp.]
MEANFFKQIAKMDIESKLTLTIAKATEDVMIVSILVQNDGCSDKAKNIIPPFNVTGAPEELDSGFFEHIKKPIQKADGLVSNMESFLKQVETAEANSAMKKGSSDKSKKENDPKEKKYRDAMEKAEKLEGEKKYAQAWSALPKASEHPEYKEIITQKKEMYTRKFSPGFFDDSTLTKNTNASQDLQQEEVMQPVTEFEQDDQEGFKDE